MKPILRIPIICCLCMATAKAQLYVQSGATLTTTSGAVVTLQNIDLQNNGTINQTVGAGKFLFNGSINNTISGTGITQFDNMEIAKTGAAKLSLAQNLSVVTNLLFTSGNIDVGNTVLQLQPNALLTGESETSRLMSTGTTGRVTISATLNAPNSVNPGNIGAIITTDQNMGATTISRGFTSQTNGEPGAKSLLRYYDVTPTNDIALNATLRLNYFDAELNGLDETKMYVFKSDDDVHFTPMGYTIRDPNLDYIALINIASFSRWTLSASNNALPITLANFTATCENNFTLLQWKSSTEVNAATYMVEKSADAANWTNLQNIAATNILSGSSYNYKDASPATTAYYRLKMVDKDGSFAYSPVVNGGCTVVANTSFAIYPNPAHNYATATLSAKEDSKAVVNIYSSNGRLVSQHAWALQKGINSYTLQEVGSLPAGNYIVKVVMDGSSVTSKLIKQ